MDPTNWEVVAELDGWVLLRNSDGEICFGDRHERDPADCPVAELLMLEKASLN